VCVEAAGVGKNPNDGLAQSLLLPTKQGFGSVKSLAKSLDAQDREDLWGILLHLLYQVPATLSQFSRRELSGAGSGSIDYICYAVTMLEKFPFLKRRKQSSR
jgi:hypothetical protein